MRVNEKYIIQFPSVIQLIIFGAYIKFVIVKNWIFVLLVTKNFRKQKINTIHILIYRNHKRNRKFIKIYFKNKIERHI